MPVANILYVQKIMCLLSLNFKRKLLGSKTSKWWRQLAGDEMYSKGSSELMCPKQRAGTSVAESMAKALYVMVCTIVGVDLKGTKETYAQLENRC